MPLSARLAAFFCGLLLAAPLLAAPLDAASYGYPLTNPFEATIATTPPELRPELPSDDDIKQSDYRISLRPEREFLIPDNFWAVQKMGYRLARQPGEAPLMFIIAGTGAARCSGLRRARGRHRRVRGMHRLLHRSPSALRDERERRPGRSDEVSGVIR